MDLQTIITVVASVVGGGFGVKLIDWWRYRDKDKADALKSMHDSTATTFTIGSKYMEEMIRLGEAAYTRIDALQTSLSNEKMSRAQISIELIEAQHAAKLCKDALEKCRNGCKE